MGYTSVIFDMDGTLVSFKFRASDAKLAIIDELSNLGLGAENFSTKDPTQLIIDKAESLSKSSISFNELRSRLWSILDSFELEASLNSELLTDVPPTLDELNKAGIVMGVVTNSGRTATERTLGKHGLKGYFKVILSRDDVGRLKPSPEGIRLAVERLGAKAQESLYVGDSIFDIKAAKDAGVRAAAITGGVHTVDALMKLSPDHLITSFSDLLKVVLADNSYQA